MGKIILNNIEYGTGTPNSSNVDTTNLVKKDNIVTVIDENVTDEQIPSAKAVHTAIQNVSAGVPVNAYTKEEVDNLLNDKVDTDDLVDSYSKEDVNNLLDSKADSTDIIDAYDKTEVDNLLANKADSSAIVDAYTKTEVDGLLADKANVDDLVDSYTKTETDDLLATKADSTALDDKLDKTAIVTSVSSTSTDTEVPSAKFIYNELDYLSDQTAMTLDNVNLANRKIDETQMDIFDNVKPSIASNTARIDNIPNPNILINGGFQINDYNATTIPSGNTSVIYVTNRWATSSSSNFSCTVNSVNEDVSFDSNKKLTLQAISTCTSLSAYQIIENVTELYKGKTLTLSFWVKGVGTGVGKTVTGRIGSGGGNTGETRVTLTNSWQYVTSTRTGSYFSAKFDGGVIITSSDTFESGGGFEITCVKLEVGDKATPFVQRAYTEELLMCQRYYMRWKGASSGVVRLANFSATTADIVYPILYLPTPMRTRPTLPSDKNNLQAYGYDTTSSTYKSYPPTGLSVNSMDNNVISLKCITDAKFSVGSSGILQIKTGDTYDFVLDAELYS